MGVSILKALINLQNYKDNDLKKIVTPKSQGQPSVNIVGEPLDFFVRDSLCNSFTLKNILTKKQLYDKEFSHYGEQNNPPDIIINKSDAIEVKKVGLNSKSMQLNSSMPKSKLKSSSLLLTQRCRNCEPGWIEKDLIYAVGHVKSDRIKILTFVYGDCYAADNTVYEKIVLGISNGLKTLNLQLSPTKELGRVNYVDPLKITNLRIRGMWTIKTPLSHFSNIMKINPKDNMSVFALMLKDKFNSFAKDEINSVSKTMNITYVKIPNPNNPSNTIDAVLISFNF